MGTARARKAKAAVKKPRPRFPALPAISWPVPTPPGEVGQLKLEWESDQESITESRSVRNNQEVLIVPEARNEEAKELLGKQGEPMILATRAKVLGVKLVEDAYIVRVKGVEAVQLVAKRAAEQGIRFAYKAYESPEVSPGSRGDGQGGKEELVDADSNLESRIRSLPLPARAIHRIEREFTALRSEGGEAARARSYLELVSRLPWEAERPKAQTLQEAKETLDREHAGLPEIKERFLDMLAAREWWYSKGAIEGRRPKGNILLVGPPGTGKTTIAQSLAEALGVPMEVINLGGLTDERILVGFDRGYEGSQPGSFIRAVERAGTRYAVIVLDEVDKLGGGEKGDPVGVLLSLLDEGQGRVFRDHYLDIAMDMSTITFVATANSLDDIHPALLDRFEVIELRAYNPEEKVKIARSHLLPRQMAGHRLDESEVTITNKALSLLVKQYTSEAGLRQLEQRIEKILDTAIREYRDSGERVVVDSVKVKEYMKDPIVEPAYGKEAVHPGTSLVTGVLGGVGIIGVVEVSLVKGGKGELTLTGELGDSMKESATKVLSLVRGLMSHDETAIERLRESQIHFDVPVPQTPIDGPSAGVAMVAALFSEIAGKVPAKGVAMTGEVSLKGEVLPIGGTAEKIQAAVQAGCDKFILPRDNLPEVAQVPGDVLDQIEIIPVTRIEEALEVLGFGEFLLEAAKPVLTVHSSVPTSSIPRVQKEQQDISTASQGREI